ncbi:MAG: DUF3990 domain-containing protein [Fibromonadales bacterium]|nr:DUF3990 domain-containing protein [Fibromonadales bacterium]
MKLYHGSNCLFEKIDLTKARDKRDFGKGFYTTTIKEQAVSWAEVIFDRYGGEGKFVYEFTFEINNDLKIKKFAEANKDWLEFVTTNRSIGETQHDFDIVIGPVANDKTNRTIALYIAGIYTAEMALDLLKYNNLNDQVSFHTEKSLSYLTLTWQEKNAN